MVSTCWTVIEGAAAGDHEDKQQFARRYGPVVRAYLAERWRSSPHLADCEDAVQDVFVECFRKGGVLERVDQSRPSGFRAFLYGVVRNVARRFETAKDRDRLVQAASDFDLDQIEDSDSEFSHVFDRAWVNSILWEAAQRQAELARQKGDGAIRRMELLRLRFHEGLPIRDIARLWQVDAGDLHHQFARARKEFREALGEVLAFHNPGTPAEIGQAISNLLTTLE